MSPTVSSAAAVTYPVTRTRARSLVPALALAFLGVLVVGTVGFSHIDALHNAAHDARHASGFPCH